MKSQIIEYFKLKKDNYSLDLIEEIEKTGSFSGLNEIIWLLQSKIKDLSEQIALMQVGSDPLSQSLSEEINAMKEYLVKSMVMENIKNLLLIFYFTDSLELCESPVDTKEFNLKGIVENLMNKKNFTK